MPDNTEVPAFSADRVIETAPCEHKRRKILWTDENFYDGDETVHYECLDCGEELSEYFSR